MLDTCKRRLPQRSSLDKCFPALTGWTCIGACPCNKPKKVRLLACVWPSPCTHDQQLILVKTRPNHSTQLSHVVEACSTQRSNTVQGQPTCSPRVHITSFASGRPLTAASESASRPEPCAGICENQLGNPVRVQLAASCLQKQDGCCCLPALLVQQASQV